MIIFYWIIIGYILITLIALPFQYRYVIALEEMKKKNKDKSQGEIYESIDVGESVLHYNAQGNFLFLLSNIIAKSIYQYKYRKIKT